MRIDVQTRLFEHALSRLAGPELAPPHFTTNARVAQWNAAISCFNDVVDYGTRPKFTCQAVQQFSLMSRNRVLSERDSNAPGASSSSDWRRRRAVAVPASVTHSRTNDD